MSAIATTHPDAPGGELIRLPAAAAPAQRILTVRFRSPDGQSWHAIGGDTVATAIAFARESAPGGTAWHAVGWNDLYGD